MATIRNAGLIPLNQQPMGTVPDVSGALQSYYQVMTFTPVGKVVKGFVVQETGSPVVFRGVIVPYNTKDLKLLSEGQRVWSWYQLYSDTALSLTVDDVILYLSTQYRVMNAYDRSLNGFYEYRIVSDWINAGPT